MAKAETYNLNEKTIASLPVPAQGRVYYRDDTERGLCLCVDHKGRRAWYWCRWIAGASQRLHLADHPAIKVVEARRLAAVKNGEAARGEDPAAERRQRREDPTFGDLFNWYLETHAKRFKRTWKHDVYYFKKFLAPLAPLKASTITRGRIRQLQADVSLQVAGNGYLVGDGRATANVLIALVAVVYAQAIAFEVYKGDNPCIGVKRFKIKSRERVLSVDELVRIRHEVDGYPEEKARDYFYLSLGTGARRNNVLSMRFEEIDFQAGTWTIPRTKNGLAQIVPLSATVTAILERRRAKLKTGYVFPGRLPGTRMKFPQRAWDDWRTAADLLDVRWHDLRRTLAAYAARKGVSLQIIGRMLGHTATSSTMVYARLDQNAVRHAMDTTHDAMFGPQPRAGQEPPRPARPGRVRGAVRGLRRGRG